MPAASSFFPAFTDCHIHMMDGGLSLGHVNLEGATNVSDIQNRLRAYADQHPDDQWILGRGWNYAMFGPETLPNKKYLDELFPAIPFSSRATTATLTGPIPRLSLSPASPKTLPILPTAKLSAIPKLANLRVR